MSTGISLFFGLNSFGGGLGGSGFDRYVSVVSFVVVEFQSLEEMWPL